MKIRAIATIMLLLLVGCFSEGVETLDFEAKIVVDGYIEPGEKAIVVLTQIFPVDSALDTATLSLIPIRWGKVTISDGDTTETMIGGRSEDYLTEFYYRTLKMRGEEGKTYTIEVEYSDITATASTSIPSKVDILNVSSSCISKTDTTYIIELTLDEPDTSDDYYMVLTKIAGVDSTFKHSLMGVWNDTKLNSLGNCIPVYRAITIADGISNGIMFKAGEEVEVKLCHINRDCYNYWLDHQELLISYNNFVYPITQNARTNIENGLGCWYGYSSATQTITVGAEDSWWQ